MEKVSENNNSANCDFDKLTLEKCTPKDPPVERPEICRGKGGEHRKTAGMSISWPF